ncbi:MAG: nucleotidyl transferase AbiEii/AbiGii toxin family protein, partial [Gemmatimonadaceae bacterium]|nr:nucleotidyl transferase AbiEii/AbiGii toxin family protein [Gemmatimonadaceae bacterium]
LPEAEYSEESIRETLRELTGLAHELSGIEFSPEAIAVRSRTDRLGRVTFEGKVGYKGPLAVPGWPRILFDITQHEPVVDEPVLRVILHPYPDAPLPEGALVSTYSLEELIAEKTRALYERSRPRDLYDVVFILTNNSELVELDHARDVFGEKCTAKQLAVPDADELVRAVMEAPEIVSEWSNMLAHQLPSLPPPEGVIARLPGAIAWLTRAVAAAPIVIPEQHLAPVAPRPNETLVASAPSKLWRTAIPLEAIRFAGANRLLVEFTYNGKPRTLEPYSLRRSSLGNLLLYGWECETAQIKCFDVSKMSGLRTTTRTFIPRYAVEFTGTGAAEAAPVIARANYRPFRNASRSRPGPIYVFRCSACQKTFRHRKNDSSLRRHRMSSGGPYCPSRRGYLERTL